MLHRCVTPVTAAVASLDPRTMSTLVADGPEAAVYLTGGRLIVAARDHLAGLDAVDSVAGEWLLAWSTRVTPGEDARPCCALWLHTFEIAADEAGRLAS